MRFFECVATVCLSFCVLLDGLFLFCDLLWLSACFFGINTFVCFVCYVLPDVVFVVRFVLVVCLMPLCVIFDSLCGSVWCVCCCFLNEYVCLMCNVFVSFVCDALCDVVGFVGVSFLCLCVLLFECVCVAICCVIVYGLFLLFLCGFSTCVCFVCELLCGVVRLVFCAVVC